MNKKLQSFYFVEFGLFKTQVMNNSVLEYELTGLARSILISRFKQKKKELKHGRVAAFFQSQESRTQTSKICIVKEIIDNNY